MQIECSGEYVSWNEIGGHKWKRNYSCQLFCPLRWYSQPRLLLEDRREFRTDVPSAVQKTITDHAGGGKIEEIEKETITQNVRILHFDSPKTVTVYEAEVEKPDGKEIEIDVGEDGELIKIKHEKVD
ncbi:hypothetical protein [Nitrosospira sp. NRS527]|uniref:hypothetical protein n=1 Tax=Nitrosospira sp. NRS527 TaxID=155925 RepID=UPI001AF81F09|nr:hypothetical protein [Nitrosospira sp. NRS527]BCT67943.1 hypothetical protein NNRS527_01535 [Nitrosospira sp. NRS527]